MGRYANANAIKERLRSKIKFADADDDDQNKVGPKLFTSLTTEAESQLEIDLMGRYEIPFQADSDGTFASLPLGTKTFLSTLAELISVIRLLETDFGRGTSVNGDKYINILQKRYDKMVLQLVEYKKDSSQTWKLPPLAGLKLSYQNQGDSGFRGRVFNTSSGSGRAGYAEHQINNPALGVWQAFEGVDFEHGG